MFTNIIEPIYTIAVMAAVLVLWILVVQYSRYQCNIKEKKGTETEEASRKFAFIPYALIPVLFAGVVGFVSLVIADTVIGRGYIVGAEESVAFTVAVAFVLYCVADKYAVRQVGKAIYFDTVIDKVVETAGSNPKSDFDEEDLKLIKILKAVKDSDL